MKKKLVFLCGARDFHAMDWYKSAKEILPGDEVIIVTDLISGEGYKKIITEEDIVYKLLILDHLLFKRQSNIGDKWRNILKLLILPIQVLLLKRFDRKNKNCIYHAHSMYYLVLARAAGVDYVGTPQGSDILVKPIRSKFYNLFAKYGLNGAKSITVDSVNMQNGVMRLVGREAVVIQNGIDVRAIEESSYNYRVINKAQKRSGILSVRGFTALYRIMDILHNRCILNIDEKITLIYPFQDANYKAECINLIKKNDVDLGRVDRQKMYQLLFSTKLVISIPLSDSSPRSVYESVFCGAPVAITYNSYYDILPDCMKSRIIIVDINDDKWLEKAVEKAEVISKSEYIPSKEALIMFDQRESSKQILNLLFE